MISQRDGSIISFIVYTLVNMLNIYLTIMIMSKHTSRRTYQLPDLSNLLDFVLSV